MGFKTKCNLKGNIEWYKVRFVTSDLLKRMALTIRGGCGFKRAVAEGGVGGGRGVGRGRELWRLVVAGWGEGVVAGGRGREQWRGRVGWSLAG